MLLFVLFIAQEFLKPAHLYVSDVLPLINSGFVSSAAYISNSGLRRSVEKILPLKFAAKLDANSWAVPYVYGWLHAIVNGLTPEVIANQFNCGIGFVMIVPKGNSNWKHIKGAVQIGESNKINESFSV